MRRAKLNSVPIPTHKFAKDLVIMDEMLTQLAEAAIDAVAKNTSKAADALTTGYIDQSKAEKKAISDSKIAVTHTATQLLTDKMKEIGISEEYARIALINEAETIVKKRSILDKIFGRAKIIVQTTPQDETDPKREIGDISDDWLNRFRESACQKSSEEAQELFSKVLAGEIRKPGSISLKALTTLTDMDQKVATLFNTFCSLCLVLLEDPNQYLTTTYYFHIKDVRMPILTGGLNDAGTHEPGNPIILENFRDRSEVLYKEYGFDFPEFQLLMEYGLISDSSLMRYDHFWYNGEFWGFLPPNKQLSLLVDSSQAINIGGYALTSIGKELYQLTKLDTPPQYFEKITAFLQDYYSTILNKHIRYADTSPDPSPDQITSET